MAVIGQILPFTAAGLGIAQKSWWEVAYHITAGRLVTVLDPFEPEPATFFAIDPVSSAQSLKIALFVDELVTTLKSKLSTP
jgi:LysR family transcriptional activator of dmlA